MLDSRTAPYAAFVLRVSLGRFALSHLFNVRKLQGDYA